MSYEPPVPPSRVDPDEDAALAGYRLAEEAGLLEGVTIDRWEALPESFCRDRELDRGRLIKRQSGTPGHQRAMRRLANALESAARKAIAAGESPCLVVDLDLDLRLWRVPAATVRRPDVVVYRCLDEGEKLWASHALLVVEVVSPGSLATDTGRDQQRTGFESKMSQYARAGIKHYWIVRLRADGSAIERIEQWRLVDEVSKYALESVWVVGGAGGGISTRWPFRIDISWSDLEF